MWFIRYLLRIHEPDEALPIFIAISKRVFLAVLALAAIIAVLGSVASIAAHGPQCAQEDGVDLFGLGYVLDAFIGCCVVALLLSAFAWPNPEHRERIRQSFFTETQVVQGDGSFYISGGVATAYWIVLALFGLAALLTVIAASNCWSIVQHCPVLAADR